MDAIAKFAYPLAAIALAFGLSACGDDITEINANVGAVKSSDDLPACTEDIVGQTAYIKETHEFLGCDGKEWQALSANTVNVGDNVCTSTSLSDGTGFEIFCNGESIGTVKNGKDGVDGKDGLDGKDGAKGDPGEAGKDGEPGAKGEKGDDGAPGTNGTNGKDGAPGTDGKDGANGTGCVIKESTALTATIACGSETFTMDLTGYVDVPEECDTTDVACTVPEGEVQLGGVSQKGPFVSGTDVTAYELENGKSLKQTGKTFGGKIENKDGSFNIRTVKLRSTYTYLVADGFYRNEVTGKNSTATIKLRALTNLDGRRTANINLVTHLEYDRVQRLVTKENMSVPAAKRAAERELFRTFGIDGDGFKGYAEDFNILKEGEGNGELLAISAMLQGDRNESELTALLAALSVDLGDNGKWDDSLRRAQVADWAMKADLEGRFATIRANVEGWNLVDSKAPAFEQHVTNYWMQELGAGECAVDNEGALFAVKNNHSAYYAANDSAYADGDSSLVRLVCDASGETPVWRFATDLEKDVTALAKDLPTDTAVAGKINTNFVYVKEKGNWRRGTELDLTLDAACIESNKGMTDSLIVKHEPVWYICDDSEDTSVPFAWREATTAEADTAGFGVPTGDDPIVRIGNVDETHVYVYEGISWRFGTDLDKALGPCLNDKLNTLSNLGDPTNPNSWYICVDDEYKTVGNYKIPTVWRKATNYEMDTYNKAGNVGDYATGNVNSDLHYVMDDCGWRPALERELLGFDACTRAQVNKVKQGNLKTDDNWYKCTNENDAFIENCEVKYTWRKATDIEKDTVGWRYGSGVTPSSADSVKYGRVNSNLVYVYDGGKYRLGTQMDKVVGSPCTVAKATRKYNSSTGTIATKNSVKYKCSVSNEVANGTQIPAAWHVASQAEWETYGWTIYNDAACNQGATTMTMYAYDSLLSEWHEAKNNECSGDLMGCTTKRHNTYRMFGPRYKDSVYQCINDSGWVIADMVVNETFPYEVEGTNYITCAQTTDGNLVLRKFHAMFPGARTDSIGGSISKTGYVIGRLTGSYYVCDNGVYRRPTKLERALHPCTKYTRNTVAQYRWDNSGDTLDLTTDYTCTADGWKVKTGTLNTGRSGEKRYNTVRIGDRIWMAENLNYRYMAKTAGSGALAVDSSSFCYDNNPLNCDLYGRLYLWSAAVDSSGILNSSGAGVGCGFTKACSATQIQGVCPSGWHLPSSTEYSYFVKLHTIHQQEDEASGETRHNDDDIFLAQPGGYDYESNSHGFSVLLAGSYNRMKKLGYNGMGVSAAFWTSTNNSAYASIFYRLNGTNDTYFYITPAHTYYTKADAASIRCVRDKLYSQQSSY